MDENSSVQPASSDQDKLTTVLENANNNQDGLPMREEALKLDASGMDGSSSKVEGCSLKMDVASPNGNMEIASPKMDATSPNMEVSPNMEESSPTMDVSSPGGEEGSAKIEEVAMKMGEVSVKSEERVNNQDGAVVGQGSNKMEEVAVKMGEVSVRADNAGSNLIDVVSEDKGSVKMEEVAVKMEKVSVKSGQMPRRRIKLDGNREKKIQFYHGAACVTEGEVPDWLTVDIIARAIRNDKPGTKKRQIRPFGPPAKAQTGSQPGNVPGSKSFGHVTQMGGAYRSSLLSRSSGSHTLNEPSASNAGRPSTTIPMNRTSSTQSVNKLSAGEPTGKPSTSQPSAKLAGGQVGTKPSSSSLPERPLGASAENKSSGLSKGKAGPSGRVKGKSSLSAHKGKAPASEAYYRAISREEKDTVTVPALGNAQDCGETGEAKAANDCSEVTNVNTNFQKDPDEVREALEGGKPISIEEVDDKVCNSDVNCIIENDSKNDLMENCIAENPFRGGSDDNNFKTSSSFKMPTDPPKRQLKKPNITSKELLDQIDASKELCSDTFMPPSKQSDSPVIVKNTTEPRKVSFIKSDLPVENPVQTSSEYSETTMEPSTEATKVSSQSTQNVQRTAAMPSNMRKLPPLRVRRFISQRLSSRNTVYYVRATAVCGSVARDYHFVVKRCANAAEVMYYRKIAPQVPYVPRVLLCDKNIVVMDDLMHEGFRQPSDGKFTPAQMTVAIDGLARMHTASVIALKKDPSLLELFPRAAMASESDIARDLRQLADGVKSWPLEDADYYSSRCRSLAESVPYLLERLESADKNITVLLHGNVSPRNVFFLYDSNNPKLPAMASFVDFSNVYWGHPALDISLVTGPAGGFWEGYKIVLLSLLTRASGRMWMPQPETKDCGETYAFALLRAACSSVSGPAAKVLEEKLPDLFPVFRQYSWLDFW